MLRAIYKGNILFEKAPVFEYKEHTQMFHMIGAEEFSYEFILVMNDPDWVVFTVSGENVVMMDTMRRLTDEEIGVKLGV